MNAERPILVERRGSLGVLTLNRPEAINALTQEMIWTLSRALTCWESDDRVQTVLITGAGERGLCAGGDIVALYRDANAGDGVRSADFWASEYRLIARLARYPKPIVAIQDGTVLGGGVGLSAHCTYRIVTERSKVGLPETRIGFVPDVGSTWLLARAPGELGTMVALAGIAVGAGDAIALGLSDHYVSSARLPGLASALEQTSAANAVFAAKESAPLGRFSHRLDEIDALFAGDSVTAILERLAGTDDFSAERTAIMRASPVAVAVTLASLRRAKESRRLEEALTQEYRVALHAHKSHDFVEGVRAQVVDKDRSPVWVPSCHEEVTTELISAYFEEPSTGDLEFEPEERRR